MRLRNVALAHFAASLAECPASTRPEIAFSGRSNVGKSSLVNLLTSRRKLAYTSKQPGKTRVLTFYLVDDRWHLVDMPGYGYARVPPAERRKWATEASRYLQKRPQLAGVVQLVDMKVGPTQDDQARLRQILAAGRPLCVAMTKADKVPRSRHDRVVADHLDGLALPPETALVVTSVRGGYGAAPLIAWIEDHLPKPGR
jgi:GTP-binding protein